MWKDNLAFSKKQRLGFFILSGLILIHAIVLLILNFKRCSEIRITTFSDIDQTANSDSSISKPLSYLIVNPNTASIKDLQELGFSNHSIINIKKYIECGGHFNSTEDLTKIYGIDTVLVNKRALNFSFHAEQEKEQRHIILRRDLKDNETITEIKWINFNKISYNELSKLNLNKTVLDSIIEFRKTHYFNKGLTVDVFNSFSEKRKISWLINNSVLKKKKAVKDRLIININKADTSMLKQLWGIGPVLANRIVKYRNKLGGFYSIEQLKEVYGISDEVIMGISSNIVINLEDVKAININKASVRHLKSHPYINFYMAKEIVEFRKAKGGIKNIGVLKSFKSFSDKEIVKKIEHYLAI